MGYWRTRLRGGLHAGWCIAGYNWRISLRRLAGGVDPDQPALADPGVTAVLCHSAGPSSSSGQKGKMRAGT